MMREVNFRFLVDVILFIAFLALLWTQSLTTFIFPSGTEADGWILWGLTYDEWTMVSFGCLVVFTIGVLVHLILQWRWVCNFISTRMVPRKDGERVILPDGIKTLYGVGTLIAVLTTLGMLLAVAEIMIQEPSEEASSVEVSPGSSVSSGASFSDFFSSSSQFTSSSS